MDYDEARRQAMAAVDAVNRRDLDALHADLHEEVTHQSPLVDIHLGQQDGCIEGKDAHREFMRWLWAQEPWAQEPRPRAVLEEVFTGPQGYAFLVRGDDNSGPTGVIVREVDADGVVRSSRLYSSRPSAG